MIPLYAAILIGGKSRRMGQPKHLIPTHSVQASSRLADLSIMQTWLERTTILLQSIVEKTIIVGEGSVPSSCIDIVRVRDISGIAGPLAGILAAMRYNPDVDWLVVACDMPRITQEALLWLLKHRRESLWGVVPRLKENGHFEPLFAIYGKKARILFEQQRVNQQFKISIAATHPKIINPTIPAHFATAWQNINTPQQLLQFRQMRNPKI